MSENTEILLGQYKNIASVNVDNYQKIELANKPSLILEYDIRNALSATEIFDAEREASQVYRLYGRIEYLSLLNGLPLSYSGLSGFFLPQKNNIKKRRIILCQQNTVLHHQGRPDWAPSR